MSEFGLMEGHIKSTKTILDKLNWKDAKFDTWFLRNKKEITSKLMELEELIKSAKDNYQGADE